MITAVACALLITSLCFIAVCCMIVQRIRANRAMSKVSAQIIAECKEQEPKEGAINSAIIKVVNYRQHHVRNESEVELKKKELDEDDQ